jgi:hypothetical protein
MSDILNGRIKRLPSWSVTDQMVAACLTYAQEAGRILPPDLCKREDWRRRYADAERDLEGQGRLCRQNARPPRVVAAGWPLAEVINPFDFDLEIHRPVQPDTPAPDLPPLPVYVARDHDSALERVVMAAARGSSGIAVLVGGSSTGKTRACWEAVRLLRDRPEAWRLWHPIDPSRPEAVLSELPSIGPYTVVWLNEAQFYLSAPGRLGERVAAGLRELLRDQARAPVVVLATLWPEYWDRLTARPAADADDLHAQARELLAGRDIAVPAAFTGAELERLSATGDPRLHAAAAAAEDGRIVQFLAGAPELMARYRNAPAAARAVLDAAIDARRLGMGIALPLAFLEAAAPGYLTATEWDGTGEDWLQQALAYTAAPVKGIRGPLATTRPRAARDAALGAGPACRLADYLEQYGRKAHRSRIPPEAFWRATARFAAPSELLALARAAQDRGLLRNAARLHKQAAAHGDDAEAARLLEMWHSIQPDSADRRPAQWAAAHAALEDPVAASQLLFALRAVGGLEQVAGLAARDPAAHAVLSDPKGDSEDMWNVAWRLVALQDAARLQEAVAPVALDDLPAVARLLVGLHKTGQHEQARTLADRAAADAPLEDPVAVAWLLVGLQLAGERQQASVFAARAAAHFPLDAPHAVSRLLSALRARGEQQQAHELATRAAAYFPLDDPTAVARLLDALRDAGEQQQADELVTRAAFDAPVNDPRAVAALLIRDKRQRATALAERAATEAPLEDPGAIAWLLDALREAGQQQPAHDLATRAAADAPVDAPGAVARLLDALREAGEQQIHQLAARAAMHAPLEDASAIARLLDSFREAGEQQQINELADRNPAAHASLDDPHAVAQLLTALRRAGQQQQATALADRNPGAYAPLDRPGAVASLLDALREAGEQQQARDLAARAVAHTAVDHPRSVAHLLIVLQRDEQPRAPAPDAHASLNSLDGVARVQNAPQPESKRQKAAAIAALQEEINKTMAARRLRQGSELRQQVTTLAARAAAQVALDDPDAIDYLLFWLWDAGTEDQAQVLVDRLPAEGHFDLFCCRDDNRTRYRFGREPGGNPSPPWNWDDLD